MRYLLFALVFLLPLGAFGQSAEHYPPQGSMPRGHMQMVMHGRGQASQSDDSVRRPIQPGQAAFAAIQEIMQILEADPHTDWPKVNIEALRQHLIDMNNVTLSAKVKNESINDGMRFIVTGTGPIVNSIRRMISAHAATVDGFGGWRSTAENINDGAALEVHVPDRDLIKLKALGFIGVMTRGMHHQEHHLMIARGAHPHG